MKMVKMFDWFEDIQPYLNTLNIEYDLCDLEEGIGNDTAIHFWVTKDKYNSDFRNILADYFLSQDCKEGETVYIWVCW